MPKILRRRHIALIQAACIDRYNAKERQRRHSKKPKPLSRQEFRELFLAELKQQDSNMA